MSSHCPIQMFYEDWKCIFWDIDRRICANPDNYKDEIDGKKYCQFHPSAMLGKEEDGGVTFL